MSPLLEEDLSNLPPAYVLTAEFDPLKDEGAAYAKRLEEAGVAVVYKDYRGAIHGFANLDRVAPMALTMHEDIKNNLQKVIAIKTV
jgi:acetyl esterase